MLLRPHHNPLRILWRALAVSALWLPLAWAEAPAEPAVVADAGAASSASASVAAPQEPLPALKVQREEDQQKWLTQQLGKDKVMALTAEGGPFIALWQPDTSGKPLGAVVLLHDEGQNLNWVNSLQNLREYLSRQGWATLSIALPDPALVPPPARPAGVALAVAQSSAAEGQGASAASSAPAAAVPESQVVYNDASSAPAASSAASQPPTRLAAPEAEPIVMARIQAALDFLAANHQYNNVLLGEGLGATRATRFLTQQPASGVRALIWINPRPVLRVEPPFMLLKGFAAPPLPILDIAYPQSEQAPWALERLQAARKAGFADYKQHLLTEYAPPLTGESRLTRLVRGYLNRYVAGKEIKTP